MALIETLNLEHVPPAHPLHLALFRDVRNSAHLRQQLLDGNPRYEYAFIDAAVIVSRLHLLAACFRGVNDWLTGQLKSRNVHSEIVFSLSPNNNISDSFRRFGVTESTKDLLVVKVATDPSVTKENIQEHLRTAVEGRSVAITDTELASITDLARVRKTYKLPAVPQVDSKQQQAKTTTIGEAVQADLALTILGAMALRGAMNT